ncbi:hypothetical protein C0993_012824 [Termitomyces sp. T159_Od127]|nr:hypothetical protein C0993_012824 [Termitomyces sp. T159_Od127]
MIALLEHLPLMTAPPPVAEPSPAALTVPPVALAAPAGFQAQIPCLALLDTYDSDHISEKCFLQSCLTYIHFSGDVFDSNALKIALVPPDITATCYCHPWHPSAIIACSCHISTGPGYSQCYLQLQPLHQRQHWQALALFPAYAEASLSYYQDVHHAL